MVPRGHFKTSLVTVAGPVWMLINNPLERVLLMHASSSKASEELQRIQRVVQGPAFRHYFPELVPAADSVRWNKTELEIVRETIASEPSVKALGIGSTVVGGHYSTHVLDDLIDENAARSPAMIQRAIDFVEHSTPLFDDITKDKQIIVGTWWPGGFYESLMESGVYRTLLLGCYADKRYFDFCKQMAVEPAVAEGEPIFPERFTPQSLRDTERKMGSFKFSHQYLNVPISEGMVKFKREDILFYMVSLDGKKVMIPGGQDSHISKESTYSIPLAELDITMTVDPASGKKDSDESAIVVCGHLQSEGAVFVLQVWGGRVTPFALIEKIISLWRKWRPRAVGIEEVAMQSVFRQFLEQEKLKRQLPINIAKLKNKNRSKRERIIDGFQPYVENHQVMFLKKQEKLIKEMLDLRIVAGDVVGKSPNRLDALAYQVDFWRYSPEFVEYEGDVLEEWDETVDGAAPYGLECQT